MTVLITNPNYDDVTSYIFYYTKEVVDFALRKGIKPLYMQRPRLTKEKVSLMIEKKNPSLLLLNGHGDKTTICGDKIKGVEEDLIKEGENHQLLEGKITYARACSAAASLGKKCVEKKGCFIGYKIPFTFWANEKWETNPAKDKTARIALEPSNELAKALLKGNTCKEAVRKFYEISKKNFATLLKKRKEPGSLQLMMALWNNIQGQDIKGDDEMKYSG